MKIESFLTAITYQNVVLACDLIACFVFLSQWLLPHHKKPTFPSIPSVNYLERANNKQCELFVCLKHFFNRRKQWKLLFPFPLVFSNRRTFAYWMIAQTSWRRLNILIMLQSCRYGWFVESWQKCSKLRSNDQIL